MNIVYVCVIRDPYCRCIGTLGPNSPIIRAQDVFQKKVDETFSDIPGVTGISDDIIVVGYKSDGSDHNASLSAVLERARATALQ